jgi:hypothetical protein
VSSRKKREKTVELVAATALVAVGFLSLGLRVRDRMKRTVVSAHWSEGKKKTRSSSVSQVLECVKQNGQCQQG